MSNKMINIEPTEVHNRYRIVQYDFNKNPLEIEEPVLIGAYMREEEDNDKLNSVLIIYTYQDKKMDCYTMIEIMENIKAVIGDEKFMVMTSKND